MTLAQGIYLGAIGVYAVFFGLFCRFFVWKRYAETRYWRCRPQLDLDGLERLAKERGKELPRLTVIVPARNEADVISRTIEHMCGLRYFPDRWEILVITDEKETAARNVRLLSTLSGVWSVLEEGKPWNSTDVLTALAGMMAPSITATAQEARVELRCQLPSGGTALEPLAVRDVAAALITTHGRLPEEKLCALIRCALPEEEVHLAPSLLPLYISLALPVAAACLELTGNTARRLKHMIKAASRAHHPLAADILEAFTLRASAQLLKEVRGMPEQELRRAIHRACLEALPTTQEKVAQQYRQMKAREKSPVLKQVDVPYDFEGSYAGTNTGRPIGSTKGRALNHGLGMVDPRSRVCGFYDAESRPHPDVLLYIAYRYLVDDQPPPIFQGPVFQVRNFFCMTAFCKIASLYQAVAHDWYLPALFRRLPFVGGTNLFVETSLLRSLGGFAHDSLTEDLELGVRAYLMAGAWPEYLPYHSSEQTPPTIRAFMRQRLRWGSGHLQVVDKVVNMVNAPPERRRRLLRQLFLKGQLEWCLYQGATLVPPTLGVLWHQGLVDPSLIPPVTRLALHGFTLTYFSFTIYAYYRYRPYLEMWMAPRHRVRRVAVLLQLLLLPLAAFLFPVPYTSALVLKILKRQPQAWAKTPRTRE
ncbi:MAG: glycosyltransferase family 2 protein [Bacillota bacterium]